MKSNDVLDINITSPSHTLATVSCRASNIMTSP